MGGLDEPTSGVISINGQLLNKTSEKQKSFIFFKFIWFCLSVSSLVS